MTIDVPTLVAIVGIVSVLSGALGTIINSIVSSRSEMKRLKIEEGRAPADAANLNVSAATQVAGISVQQTSLFAQLVTECNQHKKELQEENIALKTQKFELKLRVLTNLEDLKQLMDDHNAKFLEQNIQCSFYAPCQQRISKIISELEIGTEGAQPNG